MAEHPIHIGLSGWSYKEWRGGVFYPKALPQNRELAYLAQFVSTVEINATFYGFRNPSAFARWHQETPDNFIFAVKASRAITHDSDLHNLDDPLSRFMASGLLTLKAKLGPILWQFPRKTTFQFADFERFITMLPKTIDQAEARARQDPHYNGTPEQDDDRVLRHAVEIRNPAFLTTNTTDLLQHHNMALVCSDASGWPRSVTPTTDFVYCRLHGVDALYKSNYDHDALEQWGQHIRQWSGLDSASQRPDTPSSQCDVYVYFDNTIHAKAPANASALQKLITL